MIPVMQTKFTDIKKDIHGNCFRACVASLLEIDIEAIPAWEDMGSDGSWADSYYSFLNQHGYDASGLMINLDWDGDWWNEVIEATPGVDGYVIVGGTSPRSASFKSWRRNNHGSVPN